MLIYRNSTETIGHFAKKEFYSKSYDAPSFHHLDDDVINFIVDLRELAEVPIIITSTYRTQTHQNMLYLSGQSPTKTSAHVQACAIDFKSTNLKNLAILKKTIEQNEWLLQKYRVFGINFYTTFIHCDTLKSRDRITSWGGAPKFISTIPKK
jgi:uncharacterized protein YcbK (DUF882 family)